jgi:hypothetical protein
MNKSIKEIFSQEQVDCLLRAIDLEYRRLSCVSLESMNEDLASEAGNDASFLVELRRLIDDDVAGREGAHYGWGPGAFAAFKDVVDKLIQQTKHKGESPPDELLKLQKELDQLGAR